MKAMILTLLGVAVALAGCLPQPTTEVDLDDQVATSVSETLTAEAPLPTAPPPASDTPPPPPTEAPTLPPTDTPSPTATASPTITPTTVSGDPVPALGTSGRIRLSPRRSAS